MTPEEYGRLKNLFLQACALEGAERERFIHEVAEPEGLGDSLRSLLEADEDGPFLGSPALGPAFRVPTPDGQHALDMNGRRFRGYTISGLIAAGGMGVVYAAVQERPHRRVALKFMHPGTCSPHALRRFGLEAEVLGRLNHPGIAHIIEAGTTDRGDRSTPFFAMEFVEGPSLLEYVRGHGLSIRERVRLFLKVCEAVEHAHLKGVIHCDLKPANILVATGAGTAGERQGAPDPQPKILDFGVARATDPDLHLTTVRTDAAGIVGTAAYMSPEQIRGDAAEVDARTDVYALGVVLYELLAGRRPFDLGSRAIPEAVRVLCEVEPAPLGAIDPALRGDLSTIVATAMAKDPARRYGSVAALADDLRRSLAHQPIAARPPSAMYLLAKCVRRHRALTAAAVLLAASLIAGLVILNGLRVAAVSARDEAERQYVEARRMSRYFLTDVVTRLDRVIGAAEIRRDLLAEILRQTRDHLADRPDDTRLLDDHARTLHAMADVHQTDLRDIDAAERYVRRALAARERLVRLDPDRLDHWMELAVVYVRCGDVARARDEPEECMAWYARALEIDTLLVEQDPTSRRYLDNWYWDHDRIVVELQERRDPEALAWARRAMEIAEQLGERFPDHYLTASALGQAHVRLGQLLHEQGSIDQAGEHFAEAIRHVEQLNSMYPHSRHFLRQMDMVCEHSGRAARERGDVGAAIAAYRKMRDVLEQLAAAEPASSLWRSRMELATTQLRDLGVPPP